MRDEDHSDFATQLIYRFGGMLGGQLTINAPT